MTEQQEVRRSPVTLSLLVDALENVAALRSSQGRWLLLERLRDRLGNGFDVREYPSTRLHLFSIARTCNDHHGGLRELACVLQELEPNTLAVEAACRLITDMGALDLLDTVERDRLFALLDGMVLPRLGELYREVVGIAALGPPAEVTRLADVWSLLEQHNSRADGVPPVLAFVEHLARHVDQQLAEQLWQWADRQANRMGLTSDIHSIRRQVLASTPGQHHPDERLYLVMRLERDLTDGERFVLSHWRQAGDGPWRPERGADRFGSLREIERHVTELIDEAEVDWAASTAPIMLEFILPRELLHLPVDRWTRSAEGGVVRRLGVHYQLAIRSLERMRRRPWLRVWRNRWHRLQDGQDDPVYLCSDGAANFLEELEAALADREEITTVVLDHQVDPSKDLAHDALTVALREGVPVVVWCRQAEAGADLLTLVTEVVGRDGVARLRENVRAIRGRAHRAGQVDHLGAHVSLLWDDPERLIELYDQPGAPTAEAGW